MTQSRFWIVGGEYTDTGFGELVTGTERVLGPYADRSAALRVWQRLTEETRSLCHARFSIAQENAG